MVEKHQSRENHRTDRDRSPKMLLRLAFSLLKMRYFEAVRVHDRFRQNSCSHLRESAGNRAYLFYKALRGLSACEISPFILVLAFGAIKCVRSALSLAGCP